MKVYVSIIVSVLFSVAFRTKAQSQSPRLLPFQGRLSDANGKPILEGVRVVQFQIYSEPIEGKVLWPGEVHRVTVNGGLVNVVLGSKNPLPRDRSDQTDKSFFDQPLYLQITVDADGDGKISDDKLDPPMLPRQTILPVLFAQESGLSRDSMKLGGHDWSVLFGINNPSGKIDGTRLANITSNSIAPGAINSSLISNGSVGIEKLAPPVFALSASCGNWSATGDLAQFQPVTDLNVSLDPVGRPVFAVLVSTSPSEPATVLGVRPECCANIEVALLRNGNVISRQYASGYGPGLWSAHAAGSFSFFDPKPASGSNHYSISVRGPGNSGLVVQNCRLLVHPL